MLSFVYTYSEKTPRNGHTVKSVRIYRIKRNLPVLVAEASDTFVDEFQLVLETMQRHKLLPKRAFERHPCSGGFICYYASGLKDKGIANIRRIV